ncbi:MAG: hypothetical protein OK457_05705 [Thaumarchaeota archaeon]|nr:hypothetical protein [Nitrososphaerota archaeon]
MQNDIFAEVEKAAASADAKVAKVSWRGVLSLNVAEIGLGSVQYHLRAAKVHGDQKKVEFVKIDRESGKEVISKEAPQLFSYRPGASGERLDVAPIPANEVKETVRTANDEMIFARTEKQYFLKEDLDSNGKWTPVPASQVIDRQVEDGQIIEPFDRTTDIQIEKEGYVSLERISEYRFKEVYMLAADTDKKVKESHDRVLQLARHLLDKQIALVGFFSWGRGYQYYTAVIYPYERKSDGEMWLVMGMSEGVLQFDKAWALVQNAEPEEEATPVPTVTARKKPKVRISK